MKNTIKLLFTILLLMTIGNVQAQSHTFAPGWCKFAKVGGVKGESASLECQACNAKDKKEIEAKIAENKRRNDAIVAIAKAEKEAYENARKTKQLEDAKNKQSKEVTIALPKTKINNNKKTVSDYYQYIQDRNVPQEENEDYYRTAHHLKILKNNKVTFESNSFQSVTKCYSGNGLFILRSISNLPGCKAEQSNNSILTNEKGEQITLPTIGDNKFGPQLSNPDNDDYFDLAVYTGECTPVENDRYAKGDFHTIIYTFSSTTLELISFKNSWQHANCDCN
jgi:hypothetical protein